MTRNLLATTTGSLVTNNPGQGCKFHQDPSSPFRPCTESSLYLRTAAWPHRWTAPPPLIGLLAHLIDSPGGHCQAVADLGRYHGGVVTQEDSIQDLLEAGQEERGPAKNKLGERCKHNFQSLCNPHWVLEPPPEAALITSDFLVLICSSHIFYCCGQCSVCQYSHARMQLRTIFPNRAICSYRSD